MPSLDRSGSGKNDNVGGGLPSLKNRGGIGAVNNIFGAANGQVQEQEERGRHNK